MNSVDKIIGNACSPLTLSIAGILQPYNETRVVMSSDVIEIPVAIDIKAFAMNVMTNAGVIIDHNLGPSRRNEQPSFSSTITDNVNKTITIKISGNCRDGAYPSVNHVLGPQDDRGRSFFSFSGFTG